MMRLKSFEQSYTKQTPVTWQGHKITPKKLHHCNHLFKHNILCEFRNLVNFPFNQSYASFNLSSFSFVLNTFGIILRLVNNVLLKVDVEVFLCYCDGDYCNKNEIIAGSRNLTFDKLIIFSSLILVIFFNTH